MTVLPTAVDPRSDAYREHREALLAKIAEVEAEHAKAIDGGGPKYVDRHRARGKLLIRERIELLVDEDAPFLELSGLAGWGSEFHVGASAVVGAKYATRFAPMVSKNQCVGQQTCSSA